MRYKVAPPARSLARLETAREAVPLVPDSEADCCRAIQGAIDLDDRDTAREFLVFLQALGLVAETERGYHRTRVDPDIDDLAAAYRKHVFLVAELLDAVESGHRTTDAAFEAVRDDIPRWERQRDTDWERRWRESVEELLGWAVLFGLLSVTDGEFRRQ